MLQKRLNSYYFRWVFPSRVQNALGQRELYRSLRTSDKHLAQSRASRYYQFVSEVKRLSLSVLTEMEFQALVRSAYESLKQSRERASLATAEVEAIELELDTLKEYFAPEEGEFEVNFVANWPVKGHRRAEYERQFGDHFEYRVKDWEYVFEKCGIDRHQYGQSDQIRLLRDLLKIEYDDLQRRWSLANKGHEGVKAPPQLPYFLKDAGSTTIPDSSSRRILKEGSNSKKPSLSEAYDDFIAFKKESVGLSNSMKEDYDRYIKTTIEIIGDLEITKITKGVLKSCLGVISTMPLRNRKPYNKMQLKEICILAESGEIPEEDIVAPGYVKAYLKFWQSMFSSYLTKECDYYQVSPTSGVNFEVKAGQSRYAVLSDYEIRGIFEKSKASSDHWWYILCRLAVFTGMRKGELLALTPENFKVDQDTQRLYIFVSEGKTEAAQRRVPISKTIVDEVQGYVDTIAPGCLLFPESTDSNTLERLKTYFDFPVDDYGSRKVFHSIRHSFVTKANFSEGISNLIVKVFVGHEFNKGDVNTGTYTHRKEVPFSMLLKLSDSIKFDAK